MSLLGIQDPSIKMVVDKGRSMPIFTKNMVDTLDLGKRVLVTADNVSKRENEWVKPCRNCTPFGSMVNMMATHSCSG